MLGSFYYFTFLLSDRKVSVLWFATQRQLYEGQSSSHKEGIAFDRESLENGFKNELLAQVIHQTVSRQTAPLRELLVARALSSTMVDTADETAQPEQPMTPADQAQLDAIAKDWFDYEV